MIRILYNIVYFFSLIPAVILFALINPRRFLIELKSSWKERLGFYPCIASEKTARPVVIIRCASLGETKVALRLINDGLKKIFFVVLAVGTKSAKDFAVSSLTALADGGEVSVVFTPPDFYFFVKNFFRHIKPKPAAVIFMESDLWPEFVWQSHNSNKNTGARTILANGRVSPRTSFFVGSVFRRFFMKILSDIDRFLVRYPSDAAAFRRVGINPAKIYVTGNVKYDFSTSVGGFDRKDFGYGDGDFLLVAGSTHRPDEIILSRALSGLRKNLGDDRFREHFRIIIVPRYIERASVETAKIFAAFNPVLYSIAKKDKTFSGHLCLIVDEMGLLEKFYAICSVAFIGGSFGSRGGQEPMSAAHCGKPVIYGPAMTKFSDETSRLEASGGAIKVSGHKELKSAIEKLFLEPSLAISVGQKALSASRDDLGSAARTLKEITDFIPA